MTESGGRREVLLVGSNTEVYSLIQEPFACQGFVVHPAPNAAAAGLELERHPFDLVLVDLEASRPAARRLLELVRRSTVNQATPIIALAGTRNPYYDITLALDAGADMYATRPIRVPILLACAHALMRRPSRARFETPCRETPLPEPTGEFDMPTTGEHEPVAPSRMQSSGWRGGLRRRRVPLADVLRRHKPPPRSGVLKRRSTGVEAVLEGEPGVGAFDRTGETADFHSSKWALFRALHAGLDHCLKSRQPLAILMMEVVTTPELSSTEMSHFARQFFKRTAGAFRAAEQLMPFEGHTTCAVLPDTDEATAIRAVRSLIDRVEGKPFVLPKRPVLVRLTAGVAITDRPFSGAPLKLFDQACKALERARRSKGTRWWVYHFERELER